MAINAGNFMLLGNILKDFDLVEEFHSVEIGDITLNSKMVKPGSLFIALSGEKFHGLDFIQEVKSRGVAAILSDKEYQDDGIAVIYVADLKSILVKLLKNFYHGLLPLNLFAITGTNGKTSIANYLYQLLNSRDIAAMSVGTIGVKSNVESDINISLTTPDICSFYHLLAQAKAHNCDNFIFEASSHALSLGRIEGVLVDVAAFTNLSHDHLDFHGNLDNYFAAKKKLFLNHLKKDGVAVINIDDEFGSVLAQECKSKGIKVLTYGAEADFSYCPNFVTNVHKISYFGNEVQLKQNFIAEFEISNMTCALACLFAQGFDILNFVQNLSVITPAAGRMQQIYYKDFNARIVIDFAHTPDALEKALLSLKKNCQGKLHVLFGCGGNRDRDKRYSMGKIADAIADNVIVTDDNPRLENAASIRKDIIAACPDAVEIEGRAQAIKKAISELEMHDILLIAGKGHENYQIIGDQKSYFSDFDEVQKNIN